MTEQLAVFAPAIDPRVQLPLRDAEPLAVPLGDPWLHGVRMPYESTEDRRRRVDATIRDGLKQLELDKKSNKIFDIDKSAD